MQQQSTEYKGLIQTGVFFTPLIPQLGFLLILTHLWFKKSSLISCIREDFKSKLNLYVFGILVSLVFIATVLTIAPIYQSVEYLVYMVVIALAFYSVRLSSVNIPDLLKPFLYAVSIDTIFGIVQWLFHIEFTKQLGPLLVDISFGGGTRITSLAGHPMVLAGLSTFAFLAGIILFLYYNTNSRYLFLSLSITAFITELLTQSRGNLIAMILGLSLIIFLYFRKTIIVSIVIIIFTLGFVFLFTKYQNIIQPKGSETLIDRFQDKAGTANIRLSLWKDSLVLIQQRPLLGYGPNSWQVAMKKMVGDKYGTISDSHNTFLRLSVDFGLPFALIFTMFVLYQVFIKFMTNPYDLMTSGLTVSITIIMFLGVIDNPLSSIHMTGIFVLFGGLLWRFNKPPYEKEQP